MKWVYRIAFALICILLVAVVFAPVPAHTRWIRTLHDSAHGPIFGAVALLVLSLIRAQPRLGSLSVPRQYLLAFATVVVLGIATELAQIPAGRDASLYDVRSDAFGALGFLALFFAFDPLARRQEHSTRVRAAAITTGAVLLGILAWPVVHASIEYEQRDARFPVIVDGTGRFDRYFVGQTDAYVEAAAMPARWAANSHESTMLVHFESGPYPGIELIEPLPDWRAYGTLALDLTNPTDMDLDLVLRVHDVHHNYEYGDRFNRPLHLPARTREVFRVSLADIQAGPVSRQLDLANVASVILFRVQGSKPDRMFFSGAWLEGAASVGLQHDH